MYCTVMECTLQYKHVLYSERMYCIVLYSNWVYCTVMECTVQCRSVVYSYGVGHCNGTVWQWDIAAVMTMWQWGLHNIHCMGSRPIHFIRTVHVSVCLCCCDNPKNPLPGVLETSVLLILACNHTNCRTPELPILPSPAIDWKIWKATRPWLAFQAKAMVKTRRGRSRW